MEENKNITEEVKPTVEETVIEETQVVEETPAMEETVAEEIAIEETPAVVEETIIEEAPVAEEVVAEEAPAMEVIEEAPTTKVRVKAEKQVPAGDFDWDAYEDGVTLSAQSKSDLENIYDNTLNAIKDKEVVEGTVILINKREIGRASCRERV